MAIKGLETTSDIRQVPETWAVIPARGGSKAVPDKNIRLLAGRPLLTHDVEAALRAGSVQRVIVSTDSPRIAAIARDAGAEIVWRPPEISGDTASSETALLHVLDHLGQTERRHPQQLAFLQCTSPFTAAEDIDGCVRRLVEAEADTVVAVTPFHYFVWRADAAGDAVGVNHDKTFRQRRQDREPQYIETGAVYVMRTAGFLAHRHRFFGRTAMYVMPEERVFEIDEALDFELAEARVELLQRCRRQALLPWPPAALVMDFDGVFTDDRVLVHQDGTESVACHRGDGLGLERLRAAGLPMVVISKERNPVVRARCAKLGLECHHGVDAKLELLRGWLAERDLPAERTVYIGNDVNDLDCLRFVGCGVTPADAHPTARAAADVVLRACGGRGALRELADLLAPQLAGRPPEGAP